MQWDFTSIDSKPKVQAFFARSYLNFSASKSSADNRFYEHLFCSMNQEAENTEGEVGIVPAFTGRALTAPEFRGLAEMPAELEWFANLDNPRTRRSYRIDVADFMAFVGIQRPEEFRIVTRAHFIAWRRDLEGRGLSAPTIRRKLSALSSLFAHLCDSNAVTHNPVLGVKRPRSETAEGKTPAIGDGQARALLAAPRADTLKGKRDRAILATLLFHGRAATSCAS